MRPPALAFLPPLALLAASLGLHLHAASSLALTQAELDALGTGLAPGPAGPGLLALRLPTLALASLLPALIYGISLPFAGRLGGLAAGALCLLVPRSLLEGATLGGDGPLAALLWAGFGLHLRSRGSPVAALLAGAALAAAAATSWAGWLAWPLLAAHHAWTRPAPTPLAPRGLLAVPASAVWMALLFPLAAWLLTPSLRGLSGDALRAWLVAAASPSVRPGLWAGEDVEPATIPRLHTLLGLATALPSMTLLLAALGLWKFHEDRPRRRPDLALAALTLLFFGGWPLLCPPGLGRFPGRFALLVPAAALLAGRGLRWFWEGPGSRLPWPAAWRALVLGSALLSAPLLACLQGATLSADFSWITGGLWRVRAMGPEVPYDGSALGALLPALERSRGGVITVHAPEVPAPVWSHLHRHGWLRHPVKSSPRYEAELQILPSGARPEEGFELVATSYRDRQPLQRLWKRVGSRAPR